MPRLRSGWSPQLTSPAISPLAEPPPWTLSKPSAPSSFSIRTFELGLLDNNFALCEDFFVRVISRKKIRDAIRDHPEWAASLSAWHRVVKNADWSLFPDVKLSWRNSD